MVKKESNYDTYLKDATVLSSIGMQIHVKNSEFSYFERKKIMKETTCTNVYKLSTDDYEV